MDLDRKIVMSKMQSPTIDANFPRSLNHTTEIHNLSLYTSKEPAGMLDFGLS